MISTRQKMLDLIKQRDRAKDKSAMAATTYDRVTADQAASSPSPATDYMTLVEAEMKNNGLSKAQAMRAVTAKFPEKHAEWLASVQ